MKANGCSGSRRFSARLKCTRPTRFQAGFSLLRKDCRSNPDRASAPGVAVYAAGLAAMAASAWLSRFPRHQVALGAVMFLASDLLIFARSGPLAGAAWLGLAIWGLYFAGQALIATSVARVAASEPT